MSVAPGSSLIKEYALILTAGAPGGPARGSTMLIF